jgi:hypothetical protein
MKFSHYLTLAAFTLSAVSVATYAQTSQTFRFGEGQTTLQPGNAHPTQPSHAAPAQSQSPEATATKEHKEKHQRHRRHRVYVQDTYSHG